MAEVTASTQEHLDIEDVRDDLVLLRDASAALVLETSSVNFDLLSEVEQDSMIAAFSHLLNSLSFHVQIIVRSKKMDITAYLARLDDVERNQSNPFLRARIASYRRYVGELVSKNEVLDKRFYVVIPHLEVSFQQGGGKRTAGRPRLNRRKAIEKAQIDLKPKKDHLVKQLASIGLKSRQLTTEELVQLFYDIYNPETARFQQLATGGADYTAPFVRPAVGG